MYRIVMPGGSSLADRITGGCQQPCQFTTLPHTIQPFLTNMHTQKTGAMQNQEKRWVYLQCQKQMATVVLATK